MGRRAAATRLGLVGLAACFAPVPAAAQELPCGTVAEERRTPIDAWISRPVEIEISAEQRQRICELEAEYLAAFGALAGRNEMAVVRQAAALQMKHRTLVRSLLTPEQQAIFDENVDREG